jgi:hypothetical protein
MAFKICAGSDGLTVLKLVEHYVTFPVGLVWKIVLDTEPERRLIPCLC